MIGAIFTATMLATAGVGSAGSPGEQAAERIVSAATADWGRLSRRAVGDGEVWFETAHHDRAASYVLDKSGNLAMLSIYSANCAPFPDRERAIDLVIQALGPANDTRGNQVPSDPRQTRYSAAGNARVRVGSYWVIGFATGDLYCHRDLIGVQNDVLPSSIILPHP
jgi:hypothetical protein